MAGNHEDARFSSMHSAPIFKKTKKEKFKVKIDDRFKEVLTDDRFRVGTKDSVDKYGRKRKSKATAADELKEFYQIEEDVEEHVNDRGQEEQEVSRQEGGKKKTLGDVETRLDYLNKLARGEISGSSSDEEGVEADEESSSEDEASDLDESGTHDPFEIPGDVVEESSDVESNRIAIQNCDWENLTAEDLMVILQSFCPLSGTVKSVTVYPSDYGLSCMKEEAVSGPPKAIWMTKSSVAPSNDESNASSDDSHEEFEEDDASEDDYSEEVSVSNEGSDEQEDEEEDVNLMDINDLPPGELNGKKGDFIRPAGSRPGIVFQHDDDDQDIIKKNRNPTAKTSDIDAVALRTYELSKLRYYFAIAVVNSSATADHLYREVDGLELEHSSMALDLRIVPPEVSFQGRQVRDECDKVSIDYVPPSDFVMNAKQHTDVKCTWETGDDLGGGIGNARDRIMAKRRAKDTTASKWRDLQESDMLQYMASSGSESDENGSGSEDESGGNKSKAAMMRKLLLGDDANDEGDDFFLDDHDDDRDDENDDDDDVGDVHKVMSFMPKDEDSYDEETATPAEAAKRKRLQKKLNKKEREDSVSEKPERAAKKSKKGDKGKRLVDSEDKNEEDHQQDSTEQLELLFAGEDNETADRLKFSKNEFEKLQKNKGSSKRQQKRKRVSEVEEDSKFKVDLDDDRFRAVLQGTNPNYGIDPLANEYRATDGMQQLLNEQHKRREQKITTEEKTKKIKSKGDASAQERESSEEQERNKGEDIENLVKKLKAKSSKDSMKKPLRR